MLDDAELSIELSTPGKLHLMSRNSMKLKAALDVLPAATLHHESGETNVELELRAVSSMGVSLIKFKRTLTELTDDDITETTRTGQVSLFVGDSEPTLGSVIRLPSMFNDGECSASVSSLERLSVTEMLESARLSNGGTNNLALLTKMAVRAEENRRGGFGAGKLERLFSNRKTGLPKGGSLKSRFGQKYQDFMTALKRDGNSRPQGRNTAAMQRRSAR
ncbi:MAG TPA: hypothetical protein EYP90_11440 [Chromatiaceae bacterium]|nr:hypothetical protein [Chromatiaceae bacterium]